MSKIFKEGNNSLTLDLKIDQCATNIYTLSEKPQKFLKEPLTLEIFYKNFRPLYVDNNKKEPEVEEPPKVKVKKTRRKS